MVHMSVAQMYSMLARELFDNSPNNLMLGQEVKQESKNCQAFAYAHKIRKCVR